MTMHIVINIAIYTYFVAIVHQVSNL